LAREEVDVLREVDEMLEVLERSLEQSLKRKQRAGAISDFKERLEAIERRLEVLERWQKKHERARARPGL
jgi:DNA-binding transcriptional regulator GbsR (MarR family)